MTPLKFHTGFLRAINQFDTPETKPTSTEIEEWLNRGLTKWFITRYTGVNSKAEGFEQSEKRVEDLRNLISNATMTPTASTDQTKYTYTIPTGLVMVLNDECKIEPTDLAPASVLNCWERDEDCNYVPKLATTLDTTLNDLNNDLLNPLSAHRFRFGSAKPLRTMQGSSLILYTDGTYKPSSYSVTYLRGPQKIDIHDMGAVTTEYSDLPAYTHTEILQVAVDMFLAAKGLPTVNVQSQVEATIE